MPPVHAGMRLSSAGPGWRYTEGTLAASHGGQDENGRSAAYQQNWKSAESPAARRSTPLAQRRSNFRVIPIDFEGTLSPPPPASTRFRPRSNNGSKLVGIVEPIRSETPLNPSTRPDHSGNGASFKESCISPDRDNFAAVRTITFRESECPPPPPRRRMSLSGPGNNNYRLPLSNVPFPENLDDAIRCKEQPSLLAEPVSWFDSRGGPTSRPVGISGDYVVIPIEYIKTSPYANIAGALGRDIRKTFNKFFVPGRHKNGEEPSETQDTRVLGNFRRRNSISASDLKYTPNHKINPPFQPGSPPYFTANHRSQEPGYRPTYHRNQPMSNGFDKPKNGVSCDPSDDFASIVSQINSLCTSDTTNTPCNNQDQNDKHIRPDSRPKPSVLSTPVLSDASINDALDRSVKQTRPSDSKPQVSSIVIPPRTGQPPPDLRLVAACADLSVSDRVRTFENRSTSDLAAAPARTLRRSASFLTTLPRRPKSILKNPPAPAPPPSTPAPKSVRFDDTVRRQFFRVNSCEYQDDCDDTGLASTAPRSYVIPRPKITLSS